jgi:tetratricopeptide (TPR) repeat protein
MIAKTKKDINLLKKKLKNDPSNLDLINTLAINYFSNFKFKTDKEDYDYFEKAYKLKKTIKSTHNFAWFLYFEWSEIQWRWNQENAIEKALKIQKECIKLNPKSYYPYFQYGFMLLEQKKYKEAIPYLKKAYKIENKQDISLNIGYCYFQIDQFHNAFNFFSKSINNFELEFKSLFNLALTEYELKNTQNLKFIADKLYNQIGNLDISLTTISGYEIGLLYFLLNDYQKVVDCINYGLNFSWGINLFDWNDLSYSLYKIDKIKWLEKIEVEINEKIELCKEIETNHLDWVEYSNEEKNERLVELNLEINTMNEMIIQGVNKPQVNLKERVFYEHCGCLLFDCKECNNLPDD